jgi:hypothetical protein
LRLDPAVTAKARRFMARLITGAVLLWLVLMTTLLLHSAR